MDWHTIGTQNGRLRFRTARKYLILFGWEAGTRTPIARSRVWSPTIGRPPSTRFEIYVSRRRLSTNASGHRELISNVSVVQSYLQERLRTFIFPELRLPGKNSSRELKLKSQSQRRLTKFVHNRIGSKPICGSKSGKR